MFMKNWYSRLFDRRYVRNTDDVEDIRGKAPKGMPGAERFSPDYDGPMPKGRGGFSFGRRGEKENSSEDNKE